MCLGSYVELITYGRFSGGSHGFVVCHFSPEAMVGGPLALIEDGDKIRIDAENKCIDLVLDENILDKRRLAWSRPSSDVKRGALAKYRSSVTSASLGATTEAPDW